MNKINDMDLNLLRAFVLIYEKRSVTQAAKLAGLTQSAMSHMLARLRVALSDPLFVRQGKGLVPTQQAQRVFSPVREALAQLEAALQQAVAFDPKITEQRYSLFLADYVELALLPLLATELSTLAPKASITSLDPGQMSLEGMLEQADLAIARYDNPPPNFYRQLLWREKFVTVCAKDHPRIKRGQLTKARFLAEGHVMVATGAAGVGIVDRVLRDKGLKRNVVLKAGFFHSLPRVVVNSELIATVPRSLASRLEGELDIQVCEPPFDIPSFEVAMVWAPNRHTDPSHQWFRQRVKELATREIADT